MKDWYLVQMAGTEVGVGIVAGVGIEVEVGIVVEVERKGRWRFC